MGPNFNIALIPFLLVLVLLSSCKPPIESDPLTRVLSSDDPRIQLVMEDPDAHELQILFSEIERAGDSVNFKDYGFRVDAEYFYPASTVKFPIAVLALEYLAGLQEMDRTTRFYVEGDSVETTISQEILKIFAVSDNAANNRLLELMGQDHINQRLAALKVGPVRISHRLSVPDGDDVTTLPLIIYLNDSTTTTLEPSTNGAPAPLELENIVKGTGYIYEDSLVAEPFDFSLKNYYPITTQHEVLKRVIFPEAYPEGFRFQLDDQTRESLLVAMKILPYQAGYDRETYYDSYGKFFLFGDTEARMPEHFEIYNKVGYAYGTLTDCAYIKDTKNGVEFLLTATLLVNEDGIFNDDAYEYDDIGIPFLAALGEGLHAFALDKKQRP